PNVDASSSLTRARAAPRPHPVESSSCGKGCRIGFSGTIFLQEVRSVPHPRGFPATYDDLAPPPSATGLSLAIIREQLPDGRAHFHGPPPMTGFFLPPMPSWLRRINRAF